MIIPELIKELKIEKYGNETSLKSVCFGSMDVFSSSTVSSDPVGFHFRNVLISTVCFPASVHSYCGIQACSKMFPPPPLPATADLITANLCGTSSYRRLDFVLSTAALHSNNRLLLYVIPYRYSEHSRGQTAVSSSELTGRLGYDYTQLAPPAILSSSSAVTSGSRFLPDLLLSPLSSTSGKSKTPSHSPPGSWLALRKIKW